MATGRKLVCTKCQSSANVGALFDALQLLATNSITQCPTCSANRQIHLGFDFGLDVGGKDSVALAAFLPRRLESWKDAKQRNVTFYPFLVVTAREGRDRAVWITYWHIILDGNKRISKYGQWAPYMDHDLFVDLIEQATASGLLDRGREEPG